MKIRIKKLKNNAVIPTHGTDTAAGYDLYACMDKKSVTISPGETAKIGTGLTMEIPDDYYASINARSGLATKRGLRPANCVGIIDPDYRGEIIVALYNDSNVEQTIYNEDRIAQLIIVERLNADFEEVNELNDTLRGSGGFGSTGK